MLIADQRPPTPTGGPFSRDVCVDGRPRRPSGPESRLQVHGGDAGRTDVFASDPSSTSRPKPATGNSPTDKEIAETADKIAFAARKFRFSVLWSNAYTPRGVR